ncbi:hypothetical protein MRX96_029664 [Rhipicephalus microplus]
MTAWPDAGISARAGPVGRAQGGRGCGAPGRRCHRERYARREMALAFGSALLSCGGESGHEVQRGLFWFRRPALSSRFLPGNRSEAATCASRTCRRG